jgi:hypothetical protein
MATYHTGEKAPESGIYMCAGFLCSARRTIGRGKKIPPCPKGHKEWTLLEKTTRAKRKRQKGFLASILG